MNAGDYAILLSTGMRWYIALLFNFLSSLTALAGFFIGVSVGLLSQQANAWMLAVAAGTFFYVSLVDLVSEGGGRDGVRAREGRYWVIGERECWGKRGEGVGAGERERKRGRELRREGERGEGEGWRGRR